MHLWIQAPGDTCCSADHRARSPSASVDSTHSYFFFSSCINILLGLHSWSSLSFRNDLNVSRETFFCCSSKLCIWLDKLHDVWRNGRSLLVVPTHCINMLILLPLGLWVSYAVSGLTHKIFASEIKLKTLDSSCKRNAWFSLFCSFLRRNYSQYILFEHICYL